MKRIGRWIMNIAAAALAATASGCTEVEEFEDTGTGNYDALVKIIDTRYCFLEEKGIDWQEVAEKHRRDLKPEMSLLEYFNVCAALLDELQDGHVNLQSRFAVSYYRKWWSDYPQDFNLRTLQQYYLKFDYLSVGGISYKILPGDVGYIRYPSFSSGVSETTLDYALSYLGDCRALILDIRDNGGGLLTNVGTIVGRFITCDTPGGYVYHKTGPGHGDFSEPYEIIYHKAAEGHVMWERPIFLLTNRSCFSAANNFTAVMKTLPQVTVVGGRTGGGGGMPFTSELPNGWAIRFSASPITAPDGSEIESGIDPSEGYECHSPDEELAEGKDHILDVAIAEAMKLPLPEKGKD